MSSYYSPNLRFIVNRILGFSRSSRKIQPQSISTGAGPGSIITINWPSGSDGLCVDLDTYTLIFTARTTTTAGYAVFPVNIETIIDRHSLQSGGNNIQEETPFMNKLFSAIADNTIGYERETNRALLNGAAAITAVPNANQAETQYTIGTWLGFIGSAKPRILPLDILSNITHRITLASSDILCRDHTCTGASYQVNNIFAIVDVIGINDGLFNLARAKFLDQGGIYEVPFKKYTFFSGSQTTSMNVTTNFSLSTQSLDRIYAWFDFGGAQTLGASNDYYDPISENSTYFTRPAVTGTLHVAGNNATYGLTGYQLSIGNVLEPSYQVPAALISHYVDQSVNRSQDCIGGMTSRVGTLLTSYLQSFTCIMHSFNNRDPEGVSTISGKNTMGNYSPSYIQFFGNTTGTPAPVIPNVFTESTSTLQIGKGYQINVVN